jgi:diaminopimelate epimerase
MVATGNDFIVIDGRDSSFGVRGSELAKKLCGRKYGVGADGLLVMEPSEKADLKMRIFNPDGSEAEMCGNGSRCVALYANMKKMAPAKMKIETLAGILDAEVHGSSVKVKLTDPKDIQWNLCLMINECPYKVNVTDTGVPHVIHFVKDIENINVKDLGSKMRYHAEFSPAGANVDFVSIADRANNRIQVRTYERGVEDETLACGTGAVASAIIAAEAEKLSSPVEVRTKGNESLRVHFNVKDGKFRDVYLEGTAKLVFQGETEE